MGLDVKTFEAYKDGKFVFADSDLTDPKVVADRSFVYFAIGFLRARDARKRNISGRLAKL